MSDSLDRKVYILKTIYQQILIFTYISLILYIDVYQTFWEFLDMLELPAENLARFC